MATGCRRSRMIMDEFANSQFPYKRLGTARRSCRRGHVPVLAAVVVDCRDDACRSTAPSKVQGLWSVTDMPGPPV